MKNFRRFLALMLCVMMFITSMPIDAFADQLGGGLSDPFGNGLGSGLEPIPEDPNGDDDGFGDGDDDIEDPDAVELSDAYFERRKSSYISVDIGKVTEIGRDDVDIGSTYQYVVTVKLQPTDTYRFPDNDLWSDTGLFPGYENVQAKVFVPAGVTLYNHETGAAITPQTYDDGTYVLININDGELITVSAGSLGEYTYTFDAKMSGNGTIATHEYPAMQVQVSAEADVCRPYGETPADPTTHYITDSDVTHNNTSAVEGIGEANWGVRKFINETDPSQQAVNTNGMLTLTYYVEVGRNVNGNISRQTNDYVRYGTRDVASMTITDTISPVTNKQGVAVYPTSVTVTPSAEGSYTLVTDANDNITGIIISDAAMNTLDGSSKGLGSVKSYTQYTIKLTYPSDQFTYDIVEDPKPDFTFPNSASMKYTLTVPEGQDPDPEQNRTCEPVDIDWHGVYGGGNVRVTQKIFMGETASAAEAYGTFYQNNFQLAGAGSITYTLYQANPDGTPIVGSDAWSALLTLTDGSNGIVSTLNYNNYKDMIPEGPIALVPNYDGVINDALVIPVTSSNSDVSVPAYFNGTVVAGSATPTDIIVYLRYIDGGFVDVQKEFYSANGGKITASSDVYASLMAATSFVLTDVNDPTNVVTLQPSADQGYDNQIAHTGTYTVTEYPPQGYRAVTIGNITVNEGETTHVGGDVVKNYPSKATISIDARMTDKWVEGTPTSPETGSEHVNDAALVYQIQMKVGDTWTAVTGAEAINMGSADVRTFQVDRFDANGNAIQYRVVEMDASDKVLYGSVTNTNPGSEHTASDNHMENGEAGYVFDFGTDGSYLFTDVIYYYQRFIDINVQKVVNPANSLTLEGWKIHLTAENDTDFTAQDGVTGADGKVSFEKLPKTNAAGQYIQYKIAEQGNTDTTLDLDGFAVSYMVGTVAGDSFTVTAKMTEQGITVTNSVKQGDLTVKKVDADNNNTTLAGAKIKLYTTINNVKMYVTNQYDGLGARVLTSDPDAAYEFDMDADAPAGTIGTIKVDHLPTGDNGYDYYAEETQAPVDYQLNVNGTFVKKVTAGSSVSGTVTNIHNPKINITKYVVDNSEAAKSVPSGTFATYEIYKKGTDGKPHLVTDADGNALTLTASWSSTASSKASAYVTLPEPGNYWLKEIDSSDNLILPTADYGQVNKQASYAMKYTEIDGVLYQGGPNGYAVGSSNSSGKMLSVSFNVYDFANDATLKVVKKDSYKDTTVTALTGMTVRVVAEADPTDPVVQGLFSSWTAVDGTYSVDGATITPASGKKLYYKDNLVTASNGFKAGVPSVDSHGNAIDYYVVERTAPEMYYNKVNADGTQSNHVAKAVLNDTTYTGTITDTPDADIIISKAFINDREWDTEHFILWYGGVPFEMSLYHVDENGVLDHRISTANTADGGKANFFEGALDVEQSYLVVETDSMGFDTQRGPADTRVDIDPDSLIGMTVSDVQAMTNTFDPNHWANGVYDSQNNNYLTVTGDMTNYKPYVQLQVHKEGVDASGNPYEESIDGAKFKLYTINEALFNGVYGGDAAAAIAAGAAVTDDLVYETGTYAPGEFVTTGLDYYGSNVYILEETFAPNPYGMPSDPYFVVNPADYQKPQYKDKIYSLPNIQNVAQTGPGSQFEQQIRVYLDKVVDEDASMSFTEGDWGLSDVKFTLNLMDKSGNVIPETEPYTTAFITGVNEPTLHGRGISETIYLYKESITDLETAGYNPDDIFDFYYKKSDTDDYVQMYYADFKDALDGGAAANPGPDDLICSKFDVVFRMELMEAEYSDDVTPFRTNFTLTFDTREADTKGLTINNTYVWDEGIENPILNAKGKFVFSKVSKTVNGEMWVPADADDYVEFTFRAKNYDKLMADDDLKGYAEFTVRIDSTNYQEPVIVLLAPQEYYYMYETHAPKGVDKPEKNWMGKTTQTLMSRTPQATADDPLYLEWVMNNTEYVDVTVIKLDENGDGVEGVTLRLEYNSFYTGYNDKTKIIDANGDVLPSSETTKVTDGDGKVVFHVPLRDYRRKAADKTDGGVYGEEYTKTASYYVFEITDDEHDAGFIRINGNVNISAAGTEAQRTKKVTNPGVGDINVKKLGIAHGEIPLKDVHFDLYYTEFEKYTEYAATEPASTVTFGTTPVASGNTDANGELTFHDRPSGYYKLVETIPDGYMGAGTTYVRIFTYLCPQDIGRLNKIRNLPATTANITVYTGGAADPNNTYTVDGTTITIKNKAKGYLMVTKEFAAETLDTVTEPTSITIRLYDSVKKAYLTPDLTMNIGADGKGQLAEPYEIAPGTYTVYEVVPYGWHSIATVSGSNTASSNRSNVRCNESKLYSGKSLQGIGNVIIDSTNDVDHPVTVSFLNTTSNAQIEFNKVDGKGDPVKDAQFIAYYKYGNSVYYYKAGVATGSTATNVGFPTWTGAEASATRFTSDAAGKVLIDMAFSLPMMNDEGGYTRDIYVREVYLPASDKYLSLLTEDLVFSVTVGQKTTATEDVVDPSGMVIDITKFGRTYENCADGNKPVLKDSKFELYRVTSAGAELVRTRNESGASIASVTTDANGQAHYWYLTELENPGDKYVLVETAQPDTHWDPLVYTKAVINGTAVDPDTTITPQGGTALPGYTVFTYENTHPYAGDQTATVDVYNMPKSPLLVLKYDYEYPETNIPTGAKFEIVSEDDPSGDHKKEVQANTDAALPASVITLAQDAGYTYNSTDKYFTKDGTKYAYGLMFTGENALVPDTYTVTEVGAPSKYFFTPNASEDDPWYGVREGVEIDDDGAITIIEFANVPNPQDNNVAIDKSVDKVNGEAGGVFHNSQETLEGGEWQNMTFVISDFAPGKVSGESSAPDYVEYPMKSLSLTDSGLVFTDKNNKVVANVEKRITSVTVGQANYVEGNGVTPASTMNVSVYGVNGSSETLIATKNVASGEQTFNLKQVGDFAQLRIVYGEGLTRIDKHFKAAPVYVTFEVKQVQEDAAEYLIKTIKNTATVHMTYDIGMSEDIVIEMSDDATVNADDKVYRPKATIDKKAFLKVNGKWTEQASPVEVLGEDDIKYEIVFKNTDSTLSFNDPFIIDEMPRIVDTTASNIEVTAPAGVVAGDVVIDGGYIYVTTKGKLEAGKEIKLTIVGKVNSAELMNNVGEAINKAYGGSSEIIGQNKDNPHGTPFTTSSGANPANKAPVAALEDCYCITDQVGHLQKTGGNLTIAKTVAADVTGYGNYMAGSSNVAIASSEGNAWYSISVIPSQNAEWVRIADYLPKASSDIGINGANRGSEFGVSNIRDIVVKINGTTLSSSDFDVWTTTATGGTWNTKYINALKGSNPSGLGFSSGIVSGAKGFLIDIHQRVAKNSKIIITYTTDAPAGVVTSGTKTTYNYFKEAINTASAFALNSGTEPVHSNPAHVTIIPSQDAKIGNRIWLDMDADGVQDSGEPNFTGVAAISLREYITNTSSSAKAPVTPSDGTYTFSGLTTGILKDKNNPGYVNGNADYTKLNGTSRRMYQVVVDPANIPAGYVVTKPFAPTNGVPTTFGVKESTGVHTAGALIYDEADLPGSDTDSDFVLENGMYVSRRVYLPFQVDEKTDMFKYAASYPNFDLGVVRVRDLTIYKEGVDKNPVAGVEFSIYGPYASESAAKSAERTADDLVGTITTNEDGVATFTSTADSFINYYGIYAVVETKAVAPYTTTMLKDSFSSVSGNAALAADGDTFILKAATDAQTIADHLEKVSVSDEYVATGSIDIEAEKLLNGADITKAPFNTKFKFDLTASEKGISDFDESLALELTNNGKAIPTTTIEFSTTEWLGKESKTLSYTYTLTEQEVDDAAITTDPAVFTVTVDITDVTPDGELEIEKHIYKDGVEITDAVIQLTNEYDTGDLSIRKIVEGKAPADAAFEFTVQLTADTDDMKSLVYGKSLPVEITTEGSTTKSNTTIAIDAAGKGTITLKAKQTATIKGLPVGTIADVTEKDYLNDGYATVKTGASGAITADSVLPFVFTNTRLVSGITISKAVDGTGSDANKTFKFTIVLTYANTALLNNTANWPEVDEAVVAASAVNKTTGVITIEKTIKAGQNIVITNLLKDTEYVVTEEDYSADGYLVTKINDVADDDRQVSGKIENTTASLVFAYTNIRDAGKLSVSKVMSGNAYADDTDRVFTFKVTLENTNAPIAGEYALTEGGKVTFTATDTDGYKAEATITLKGGETKTIENILAGTAYTVEETGINKDLGYAKIADENLSGPIVAGETAAASVTNERVTNGLTIGKTVDGTGKDTVVNYLFTIVLTYADDIDLTKAMNLPTAAGAKTAAKTGDHEYTITVELKNGDSFSVTDILKGTAFKITEDDYSSKGFVTKVDGTETREVTGTIADDTTKYEYGYVNTRDAGNLKLTKVLTGNGVESSRDFAFTVELTGAEGLDLTGEYATSNGSKKVKFSAVDGKKNVVVSDAINLRQTNSTITILDIPAGVSYEVSEADYKAFGYVVADETALTGPIESGKTAESSITNKRTVGGIDLSKAVSGTGEDTVKNFEFTVVLTYGSDIDLTKTVNLPTGVTIPADGIDNDAKTVTFKVTVASGATDPLTIANILTGTKYDITETDYSSEGFIKVEVNGTEVTDRKAAGTVEEADPQENVAVAYTNTRNAGSLKVEKVLAGNATVSTKDFEFVVTLVNAKGIDVVGTYKTENGKGTAGTLVFTRTEGATADTSATSASFKLKGGESLTILDIPEGTTYTVTEADYKDIGYTIDSLEQTDDIDAESADPSEAIFTNERNVNTLTLSKVISGGGEDTVGDFAFTVVLTYNEDIDLNTIDVKPSADVTTFSRSIDNDKHTVTFTGTLKATQSVNFTNILTGTAFTITETDYKEKGFLVVKINDVESTTRVAEGTIADASTEYKYTYDNVRKAGGLSVEKKVKGNATDAVTDFSFTVTLTNEDGVPVTGTYSAQRSTQTDPTTVTFNKAEGNTDGTVAVATFTLKAGETINIKGIVDGTKYKVEEASYRAYDYTTTKTGEEGTIGSSEEGKTGSSEDGNIASFENERSVNSISVSKAVSGTGVDVQKNFVFTAVLTYEDDIDLTKTQNRVTVSGVTGAVVEKTGDHVVTVTATLKNTDVMTIGNILVGTAYEITETDYSSMGYVTKVDGSKTRVASGTVEDASAKYAHAFENVRDAGELTVKKLVAGTAGEANRKFKFTITLENETAVVSGKYTAAAGSAVTELIFTEVTGTDGHEATATVELKKDQFVTLLDIPAGTGYNVVEENYAAYGYVTTKSAAASDIVSGKESVAEYTNTREKGSIELKKEVVGKNSRDKFEFTIVLTYSRIDLTKTENLPDVTGTVNGNTYTIVKSIAAGETLTINNILVGTNYEITETDYSTDGFSKQEIDKPTGKIETDDQKISVKCTNTRESAGLTIAKTIAGSAAESDREFTFTVTLKNATALVNKTYATEEGSAVKSVTFTKTDAQGHEATATVVLKGGEQVIIADIVKGTEYTVTEASYKAYGYVTTDDGKTTGTVPGTEAFTNTREMGSIELTKEVVGTNSRDDFEFTIVLTYPEGVKLTETENLPSEAGTVSGQDYTIKKSIAANEKLTISNILVGTTYSITETDYSADGFSKQEINKPTGKIETDEQKISVKCTNTRESAGLTISKAIAGSAAESGREFTFTVTLKNATALVNKTYATEEGSAVKSVTFTKTDAQGHEATATVVLKGGEQVIIADIVKGTEYTVTEADYKAYGYVTTDDGDSTGTVPGTEVITNTREQGSLTITKTVVGTDAVVDYEFTIVLTYADDIDLTKAENLPTIGGNKVGTVNGHTVTIVKTIKKGEENALTIDNILVGTSYVVTEKDYSAEGFNAPVFTGDEGSITTDEQKATVSCVNTRESAGLTVSKTVTGNAGDKNAKFHFTVLLTNATAVTAGEYLTAEGSALDKVTFTATGKADHESKAEFDLTDGQFVTITDIVKGTAYSVSETNYSDEGYTTTPAEAVTGKLDVAATAAYTNNRIAGSLIVSKAVQGGGTEVVPAFEFTIELTYADGITASKAPVPTVTTEGTVVSNSLSGSKRTIKVMLADKQDVTIGNILVGTEYTVTEKDYSTQGFNQVKINGEDSERVATGFITKEKEEATFAYTNVRNAGGLLISKEIAGNAAEKTRAFEFRIDLENIDGVDIVRTYKTEDGCPETYKDGVTFTKNGVNSKAYATIYLKGGESITITQIPENTKYTVTETGCRADDYDTTANEVEGYVVEGKVENDKTGSAEFVNTRNAGYLQLSKTFKGDNNPVEKFEFTIVLTYEKDIDLTKTNNKVYNTSDEGVDVTIGSVVKGTDNQTVTITAKIPAGKKALFTNIMAGTDFAITETDYTAQGFLEPVVTGDGLTGTIGAEGKLSFETAVENTREAGKLTVKKTLDGNAPETDREFTFIITLTNENGMDVAKTYTTEGKATTLTFTAKTSEVEGTKVATATIKLKGDEYITITDIPSGTTYKVEEASARAYDYNTTEPANAEGTVSGTPAEVEFINERSVGEIDLSKIVTNSGEDLVKEFEFTIVLTYQNDITLTETVNQPKLSGATSAAIKSVSTTDHTITIEAKIKDTETLKIENVLVDTTYVITEKNYFDKGYSMVKIDEDTVTVTGTDTVLKVEGDISAKDEVDTHTYENIRKSGDMKVSKVLDGNAAEEDREFTFTVELTNKDNIPVDLSYKTVKTDAKANETEGTLTFTKVGTDKANATATFTLKGGETLLIKDIVLGTVYEVTEDTETARKYDYNTTKTGETGDISDTAAECVYTNERSVGEIDLTKKVTNSGEDLVKEFEFTIVLTYQSDIVLTETVNKPVLSGATSAAIKSIDGNVMTIEAKIKDGETLKIENVLVDTTYVITEKNYFDKGYSIVKIDEETVTVSDSDTVLKVEGDISAEDELDEHTYENIRKSGHLSVTKTLDGNAAEEDREFTFTVELTNKDNIPVDFSYKTVKTDAEANETEGTLTFTKVGTDRANATATFTLKGGETLLIKDIIADTGYVVSEKSERAYDYNTTKTGDNDIIVQDQTVACEYVNERSVGTIELTKTVSGTGKDVVVDFEFDVVLTYQDDITLTETVNKPTMSGATSAAIKSIDTDNHTITIAAKIRNGETLKIENVLVDTTYVITEKNYHLKGFLKAIIDGTEVAVDSTDVVLATAEDSISAKDETDTHTYENVRNAAPLTVKKTLDGNAVEYDHPFWFTVTLTREDDVPVNLTYTTVKTDAEGNETNGTIAFTQAEGTENKATARFSICGDESFKIEDILYDTSYTVVEDDYQPDGYLTDETEFEGTIETEDGCEEEFINRRNYSDLIVEKKLAGNSPEFFREFTFTVTLERAADRLPVDRTYPTVLTDKSGKEVPGSITFVTNAETGKAEATFTLHGNEKLLISEIYADSIYTVDEASCSLYGYVTTRENEEGVTDKDTPVTCTYTNTRDTGTLTITKTVEAEGMNIPTSKKFEFIVELYRNNGEGVNATKPTEDQDGKAGSITFVGGKAKVTLCHGQSLTIKDIQLDYTYNVTEKEYVNVETTSSGESGTITKDGSTAAFVNKIKQVYVPLTVIKVWDDSDDIEQIRPTYVTVVIKANGKEIGRYELNEACDWRVDLADLPRYTDDGVEIIYTVDEDKVPAKYTKVITADATVITIKNKHNPTWPHTPMGAGINLNEGYCFD